MQVNQYGDDSDGEEGKTNQIFNVKDAVPPDDFDAPYSQLPSSVQIQLVKTMVKKVYLTIAENKKKEKAEMMTKVRAKT